MTTSVFLGLVRGWYTAFRAALGQSKAAGTMSETHTHPSIREIIVSSQSYRVLANHTYRYEEVSLECLGFTSITRIGW
jgi:hypothetical protein